VGEFFSEAGEDASRSGGGCVDGPGRPVGVVACPDGPGSEAKGSRNCWSRVDDLDVAGVITASEPSWISPFTGLSPRCFGKLVTALRREGVDAVRKSSSTPIPDTSS
jgi:hypothetical protein